MAEYIRKDAVMRIATELGAWETQNRVRDLPAEDVQPVKWISVEDNLPEAGVHVLVTDGIHTMVTWCECVDDQCLWVDNYYEYVNVRFNKVTHWLPLPELPKE